MWVETIVDTFRRCSLPKVSWRGEYEALDFCLRPLFIRTAAAGRLGPGPSVAATGAGTGPGRTPRTGQLGLAAPTLGKGIASQEGLGL